MKLFIASSLLVAGFSGRAQVAADRVSPGMSNTISKKRERRLGKGLSSIDTTISTASSNKLETKSTTSKSSVSDNLDVGILSNEKVTDFDEVFTWVDHDAATTRGRGGGRRRRRRRHGRKNGHGHKQNHTLSRHKDKLLAKLYGSKVSHTNNDINIIDTGIMQMDLARVNNPTTCLESQGYVNCTNGYNVEDSDETCAQACGEECCDGEDACTGFTGLICKDSYSCNGEASCYNTTIDFVVYGCNGNEACVFAGDGGGSIGAVRNSCIGPAACAFAARDGGNIDGIEDSCNGDEGPCGFAAAGYIEDDQIVYGGGTIGMIKSSCNGEDDLVCFSLAYANGTVGDVVNSCEGKEACALAASFGGSIEGIEDSCLDGEYSCGYAAAGFSEADYTYDPNDGGSIGMIESSCIGENSCYKLAYYDGSIGNITSSCKDTNACYYAAYVEGIIDGIAGSCNDISACEFAAAGSCNEINNTGEYECESGGSIGMLKSSCVEGEKVCGNLAMFSGTIGDVFESCDGYFSCYGAATYSGSISGLNMSCIYGYGPDDQEGYACYYMASSYGIIGLVKDSCMSYFSCGFAASCDFNSYSTCEGRGNIGNITKSCLGGENACKELAGLGGSVGNVFMSCDGKSACLQAAYLGDISGDIINSCQAVYACDGLALNDDIEGDINSCCNTERECGINNPILPSECSMVTTQSPSKAPSSSPSKTPSSSPSMSPLSPTPSPTSPPSVAPTSATPTLSLEPTQVMSSKSAKSKGRKSKQSKKSKTSKSAKALSMNLTTSLDQDDSEIRRKRIRKHAPGASGKLPSLIGSDEQ